jgi:putative ABC transport system ATP-binding protein
VVGSDPEDPEDPLLPVVDPAAGVPVGRVDPVRREVVVPEVSVDQAQRVVAVDVPRGPGLPQGAVAPEGLLVGPRRSDQVPPPRRARKPAPSRQLPPQGPRGRNVPSLIASRMFAKARKNRVSETQVEPYRAPGSAGSPAFASILSYSPPKSVGDSVPAVSIRELKKSYVLKSETVHALRGVSFDVPEGDYVAIMGPSGSGKSTLLNLLGCLDKPTSGHFYLGTDDVASMNDDQLAEIRSQRIGFVFQSYNLIQQYTVVENILVPLYYQGRSGPAEKQRAIELARSVGLGERLDHRPMQLSGGQQQRVAIARSLMNDPYFILADEATGNLDSVTTEEILNLFDTLNNQGRTIIMVTHEDEVAARAKRIVRLADGLLSSDRLNTEESRQEARRRQHENILALAQRKV